MARPRHPKKDVEKALQYAESLGCRVDVKQSGHCWAWLIGLNGARLSVAGTPKNPTSFGKRIREWANKHHP